MNTNGCDRLHCPLQSTENFSCNLSRNECCYYTRRMPQTMFELIKCFNLIEMAEFVTTLCRERDEVILEQITKQGYDASLVSISFEKQVEENIKYLLQNPSDLNFS